MNHKNVAKIFKAFGDANRMQILAILQQGETCACQLLELLHIGQSTLSHHMKILCESGIVSGRKEGKWVHYSINKKEVAAIGKVLQTFLSAREGARAGSCNHMSCKR